MSSFEDPPALRRPEEPAPRVVPHRGGPAVLAMEDVHLAERCAWSVVWLAVIAAGFNTWSNWTASSALTVVAPVLVLGGTAGIVGSWVVRSPRWRPLQWLALGAVVVALVASQYGAIHTRHYYSTDSAAFDHVAALSLVHGHDPYTASMGPATGLLDLPAHYWTYTDSGGHVDDVSYPAGSFLVVAPAMLLGFRHVIVDWVDLLAWIVTGVLLFLFLPVTVRWLSGLLLLTPWFAGAFSSGGTDAAFLPFLVLAVWRWDRFGEGRTAGVARWLGPVALGLACAIKQSPWFCVPFLVAGIFLEARRSGRPALRRALRYATTVVAVFGAVNLPFIVWSPRPWLHGTLTPFVQPLVADGQGLVSLATHGAVRGANLTDLTICGGLVYVALVALYIATYPRLKRAWLLAVPVAMFFSTRSLSTYLVDFVPAALIAAFTVSSARPARRAAGDRARAGIRRLPAAAAVSIGAVGGAVLAAAVAFVNPPLQVVVRHTQTGDGGVTLTALTVSVRNLTGSPQLPHVLVDMGSLPDGFWLPRPGPMVPVPAHSTRTFTLYPPVVTYTALRGVSWVVDAYTTSPRALSTSALQIGRRPPMP